MEKLLLIGLAFLFFSLPALVSAETDNKIPEIPVFLGASSFTLDGTNYLSLSYKNHPHWHTYWKNPGDAGLPLKYSFIFNHKNIQLEEVEWPAPSRHFEEGNMLAYGYENEYSLFFRLPESIKSGPFQINSNWLVCKNICIPGKEIIKGRFAKGHLTFEHAPTYFVDTDKLKDSVRKSPREIAFPDNLDLILVKTPNTKDKMLTLYYNLEQAGRSSKLGNNNILTPFPLEPFSFIREKLHIDKKGNYYARFDIEWDGEYSDPEIDFPEDGKFKTPYTFKFLYKNPQTGIVSVITKEFSSFSLTTGERLQEFFELLRPVAVNTKVSPQQTLMTPEKSDQSPGIFYYLILAFIGGLILNFMPCVLPVISIKIFGLIKHRGDGQKSLLKHNLAYTLGVLLTFLALSLIIIFIKSAGETIGWGFQLQSPVFVLIMILILFIFALNLFGLFEFRTPGGSKLGGIETRESFIGDLLGGVLATILSTPCSAPFLGTALTFAFSAPPLTIISLFMFIGLGLASPFLLTAFFPKLIAFFPRPGLWMESLKKFMGLTLILTSIWLIDVFSAQVGVDSIMLQLNILISLIFFCLYMKAKITKKLKYLFIFYTLALTLFINIIFSINKDIRDASTMDSHTNSIKNAHGLIWEKWSVEKMNHYKISGDLVFIDFTAKWCFTCKVNERLVINTDKFKNLVKNKNIKLLLGDWTKRDEDIGIWLKQHGHVGVPAYFVINKKGILVKLGETISIGEITNALN